MDSALYYDLQRRLLVRSLTDSTPYILPTWFAGETRGVTVYALLPTGDPLAPYAVQTITGLLLTLNYTVNSLPVTLASLGSFTVRTDGGWSGNLALTPTLTLPVNLDYSESILAADIFTASARPHIESRGVLKNPAFAIAPPGLPGPYPPAASLALTNDPRIVNAYENYAQMAASAVDALTAGKTASTATQNFFSVYNPTTAPKVFTRNATCITPWPSYVSVWNSANADGTGGNRGCVTMVSPTQGISNHHFAQPYAAGVVHIFLGTDGAQYPLAVASSVQVGATDIQLVTFTSAAPTTVGVASFLPAGTVARILPVGTPVISSAQDRVARINEIAAADDGAVSLRAATFAARTTWTRNPPAVTGDSDQPSWAIINGAPVVLTTWQTPGNPSGGPSISGNIASINALLATGTSLSVVAVNPLPAPAGGGTRAFDSLGELNAATPDFLGQLAYLNGNSTLYFAQSLTPGGWNNQLEAQEITDSTFTGTLERVDQIGLNLTAGVPVVDAADILDVTGSVWTVRSNGKLELVQVPAGQSIRRKADGTGFEPYMPGSSPFTGLAYSTSIAIDLSTRANRTLTLTGNTTLTSTGAVNGGEAAIVMTGGNAARTITVPAAWTFVGSNQPDATAHTLALAANKTAVLSLSSTGTADAGVIAAYAVQP